MSVSTDLLLFSVFSLLMPFLDCQLPKEATRVLCMILEANRMTGLCRLLLKSMPEKWHYRSGPIGMLRSKLPHSTDICSTSLTLILRTEQVYVCSNECVLV